MVDRVNDRINRDDLFTMMEAYKNMIETNLILVEKQDIAVKKLEGLTNDINNLAHNLLEGFKIITDSLKSVDNHHAGCAINQRAYCDELKNVMRDNRDDLKNILRDNREDSNKKHMNQNLRIFGLITLLCSIILGLIGLIYKIWPGILLKP